MSETKVSAAEKKKTKKPAPKPKPEYAPEGEHHYYPRRRYYYRRPPLYNVYSLNSEGMLFPSDQADLLWKANNFIPPAYHYFVQRARERGTFDENYGEPYDPEEHEGGEDFSDGTARYWMRGRKFDMIPFQGQPKPYGSFTSPIMNPDKGMPPALRRLRKARREEEEGGVLIPATPSIRLM